MTHVSLFQNVTMISEFTFTEMMETDNDSDSRQKPKESFFYCDNKCLKGVLVRLKADDQLNVNLKVYIRYLRTHLGT